MLFVCFFIISNLSHCFLHVSLLLCQSDYHTGVVTVGVTLRSPAMLSIPQKHRRASNLSMGPLRMKTNRTKSIKGLSRNKLITLYGKSMRYLNVEVQQTAMGKIMRKWLSSNTTKVPKTLRFSSVGTEVAEGRALRVQAKLRINIGERLKTKIVMENCWFKTKQRGAVITQRIQTRTETSKEPLVCLIQFICGQMMRKHLKHKTDRHAFISQGTFLCLRTL